MESRERNWHNIEMLAVFTEMVDGMLESALEQKESLQQVKHKPHILDDETVQRIITLYSERIEDRWLIKSQLDRWLSENITSAQKAEVNRLLKSLKIMAIEDPKILEIARSIEHGAIDKILDMDDAELGMSVLSGKIKSPFN